MGFSDDILSALPDLREAAESLMIHTGVVRRPGLDVTDPDTAVVTPGLVEVYTGECKLQGAKSLASEPVAAGQKLIIENLQVHFPVRVALQIDDVVEMTVALDPDTGEPDMDVQGKSFRLVELDRGSLRTAKRWNVELVVK